MIGENNYTDIGAQKLKEIALNAYHKHKKKQILSFVILVEINRQELEIGMSLRIP